MTDLGVGVCLQIALCHDLYMCCCLIIIMPLHIAHKTMSAVLSFSDRNYKHHSNNGGYDSSDSIIVLSQLLVSYVHLMTWWFINPIAPT